MSINGDLPPHNLQRMTGGQLLIKDSDKELVTTGSERDILLPEDKADRRK
ncbi:hypothetical protein AB2J22_12260 [Aeromonas sp. A5]